MLGVGIPELSLILIIGLVVFGPGKLPDIGKAVGKSIHEFKSASNGEADKNPAVNKIENDPKQEVK